jgi:Flp pilus assembly protein TadD
MDPHETLPQGETTPECGEAFESAPSASARSDCLRAAALALLLVAATAAVFAQVVEFDFITFDDNVYVTENPHVQAGLSWTNVRWALGAHECNWHPLTWLSLMLDAEVWGSRAAGFHLVNLLLHTANVLLLFLLLLRTTRCAYRSAFAALLFGIHPLHVESVAWIAERKDVLSTFFWFLTMHAYVGYAKRPSAGRYASTAAAFATGLLCKPMLVTLPVVLLLLDLWPLARFVPASEAERATPSPLRRLVLEKVPLLALSAASSVITLYAQQRGGAVARLVEYPFALRLENAAVSTIAYLANAFWPSRLSVFYPHPGDHLPSWEAAVCGALVVALSVLAIYAARSAPYLTFGWFWYVVTLLPVIGLIQVGTQGMADRYTYVPLVGIFVALSWGIPSLVERVTSRSRGARVGRRRHAVLCLAGCATAMALGVGAHKQAAYWRDSITLFEHAQRVTADNAVVHSNLGRALFDRGELDRALAHGRAVIRLDPAAPDGYFDLGVVLERMSRVDEAVAAYREAIRIAPDQANAHRNLGNLLAGQGRLGEAEDQLRDATRAQPDSSAARNDLGIVLGRREAYDEAIEQFSEALRLDPANERARVNLARARDLRQRGAPPRRGVDPGRGNDRERPARAC